MRQVLHPSVTAAFWSFSMRFEGYVEWLYPDILGLVSIGVGNLVDPIERALTLRLRHPDGTLAHADEIRVDWHAAKKVDPKVGAPAAKAVTKLRMSPEDIRLLVGEKRDAFAAELARRFPELPAWPAPAQFGLMSMGWAMGTGFAFPRFEAAARGQDFATCAQECKMREAGNPGLVPRNVANRALFLAAAEMLAEGADPGELRMAPRGQAPAPDPGAPVPGAQAAYALAVATPIEPERPPSGRG